MCDVQKELVLNFCELRVVSLRCKDCGVAVVLDMADDRKR